MPVFISLNIINGVEIDFRLFNLYRPFGSSCAKKIFDPPFVWTVKNRYFNLYLPNHLLYPPGVTMLSVLGSYETDHKRPVLSSDIDYYGRYLCTGSADGVIRIVDTHDPDQRPAVEIRSHVGPVRRATFSHPKFGFLASCGSDGKLFVHRPAADRGDGDRWEVVYAYDGRGSPLTSVDWAPHKTGATIACSGADGAVSVHTLDRRSGEWSVVRVPNAHPNGVNCVGWSSRLVDGHPLLVSGGNDGKIKIWRQRNCTWTAVHETDAQSSAVVDVSWCPTPGFHEHVIAGCASDGTVVVWESDDLVYWTRTAIDPGEKQKRNVSWSRSGNILSVTMSSYVVKFWKQVDGQKWMCLDRRIAKEQPLSERQNKNTVNQSVFSTVHQ